MTKKTSFEDLCGRLELIYAAHSAEQKQDILKSYFLSIEDDESLETVIQFLTEGVFATSSGKRLSIGSRTISTAAAKFCEVDYELVFKPCREVCVSLPETISTLFNNIPEAFSKCNSCRLDILTIKEYFHLLQKAKTASEKKRLLISFWSKMDAAEVFYFLQILLNKPLMESNVYIIQNALSAAFDPDGVKLKQAILKTGSLAKAAVLAKNKNLDKAALKLFRPIEFLDAQSVAIQDIKDPQTYFIEALLPGLPFQIHIGGGNVAIFSSGKENVSSKFPEIIKLFSENDFPETVLCGTICICKENHLLNHQFLFKRLKAKQVSYNLIEKYPALFLANDLLFANGFSLIERVLEERLAYLAALTKDYNIHSVDPKTVSSLDQLNDEFNASLENGYQGLFLRRKNSIYRSGTNNLIQIKKPTQRLNAVIMYAHRTSGKVFDGFTLGISVKNDPRYKEDYIPIGKVEADFSECQDSEFEKQIQSIAYDRFGPTIAVSPDIVTEIEFEEITINKRTKATYSLSQPKVKRIIEDLKSDNVHTLQDIEKMFDEVADLKMPLKISSL